jgi:hypothetical protein
MSDFIVGPERPVVSEPVLSVVERAEPSRMGKGLAGRMFRGSVIPAKKCRVGLAPPNPYCLAPTPVVGVYLNFPPSQKF